MNAKHLKFGEFELDVAGYELSRHGRTIKLERIPMELLLLLVDRRGQLVTRDEILEKLWGKDVFLDADNSINTAISKIRVVLKEDQKTPRILLSSKPSRGKGTGLSRPSLSCPKPRRNSKRRSTPGAAVSSPQSTTLEWTRPWPTGLRSIPNLRSSRAGGGGCPSSA